MSGPSRKGSAEHRDPRRLPVLKSAAGAIAVLGLVSAIWAGVRALAYRSLPPGATAPFVFDLAVFAASLVAFGLVVRLLGIFMIKGKRRDYFAELNAAMRAIAKGDFDVAVKLEDRGRDYPLGQFAGELNDMALSLKSMEVLRQEFVSTVSHDIQSPLTSIAGFARALRDDYLPEATRRHYLDIIERESGRLSRLSDDLLRLTALEARSPQRGDEPYRLDEQIRSVVLVAEPQWRAKGLEPVLELEDLRIRADEDMLGQVWTNLLHNAIKFSPPGGGLELGLRRAGERAIFRVVDEGIGIDEADLPFVFDRFFKADRSRTRTDPAAGSGLGLAIVKKIVELHGGLVRAESPGLGKGSSFTVELPLDPI